MFCGNNKDCDLFLDCCGRWKSTSTDHLTKSLKVMAQGWPTAPGTLDELMRWASYNANQLLISSPEATENRKRFQMLAGYRIEVFDSYSGTGSGSVTLHSQYKHMMRATSMPSWSFFVFYIFTRISCSDGLVSLHSLAAPLCFPCG